MHVDTFVRRSKLLLDQSAKTFEQYAENHRAKLKGALTEEQAADTTHKAERNEAMAVRIREFLAELGDGGDIAMVAQAGDQRQGVDL